MVDLLKSCDFMIMTCTLIYVRLKALYEFKNIHSPLRSNTLLVLGG